MTHLNVSVSAYKQVADICVKAETEENLNKYSDELGAIRQSVRDLALKFPVPSL